MEFSRLRDPGAGRRPGGGGEHHARQGRGEL